ncbi:hypothetical protein EXIGLDRAFT_778018 [Exidia glandulosa HHB12029]|uniref:Ubiquitin-like protease family profile domain-containing protein n=1 Tax=Exidia glandulosa HHB12029 TaxID=1314781 RepID=A0A165CRY9_EXIGL|nr:hypothetical protein EXIGLDRAFT_778018 [Exidia glandulosa HHB12029]
MLRKVVLALSLCSLAIVAVAAPYIVPPLCLAPRIWHSLTLVLLWESGLAFLCLSSVSNPGRSPAFGAAFAYVLAILTFLATAAVVTILRASLDSPTVSAIATVWAAWSSILAASALITHRSWDQLVTRQYTLKYGDIEYSGVLCILIRFSVWVRSLTCRRRHSLRGGSGPGGMQPLPSHERATTLWQQAEAWLRLRTLSSHPRTVDLAHRCLTRLSVLPKNCRISCFNAAGLTTNLVVELLGSAWLSDEHIAAGNEFVAQELGSSSRVQFTSPFFFVQLVTRRERADANGSGLGRRQKLDSRLVNGDIDVLVMPAHVYGNHWTQFHVYIEERTISYLDPRDFDASESPPAEFLSNLRWWLGQLLDGAEFALVQPSCTRPLQTDSHSCGVAILSTSAAVLLGYPSWSQADAQLHRMEWFLRFSGRFLDDEMDGQDRNDGDEPHAPGIDTVPDVDFEMLDADNSGDSDFELASVPALAPPSDSESDASSSGRTDSTVLDDDDIRKRSARSLPPPPQPKRPRIELRSGVTAARSSRTGS